MDALLPLGQRAKLAKPPLYLYLTFRTAHLKHYRFRTFQRLRSSPICHPKAPQALERKTSGHKTLLPVLDRSLRIIPLKTLENFP